MKSQELNPFQIKIQLYLMVPRGQYCGFSTFSSFSNDLPRSVWNQIATAMFADDAKCYRAVQSVEDGNSFHLNLDNIVKWCLDWRMDLNQTN